MTSNIILMTGTVKFFIESKGYGFITNDETGKEIFVHVSSLNGLEIKEGDKVTYSEVEGKKESSLLMFSLSKPSIYC